ncbi:MAG: hypothetical protein ACREO5_14185, partial [Candidatus Binatia bacterium]
PLHSPGRRAIKRAARQIKIDYLSTVIDKKRSIFEAIRGYNTKIDDIVAVTGIGRAELESLLGQMVDDGELHQSLVKHDGAVRPYHKFVINYFGK